ncbi:fumarylacetoacetate hydrolase family protein [Gulosibacter sp. ACHW.36C]|uniref:Fumarylacetoacetate hydrolase family protein n=1 Tax=Gulosibacter sediminis TaxID=1729695 RepID=A0ABY4MXE5_9MICO|nr:fumarylacetoacetate hydrolase family protein [Gulosibacter sediminis]UQN15054.1 fumarylacetoacetate hydrolase family protein [Gulosibacter sediminis]
MKLVSYAAASAARAGVLVDGDVYDASQLFHEDNAPAASTLDAFVTAFGDRLSELSANVAERVQQHPNARVDALANVTLLGPIAKPGKVLCIGLNYKDHVAETGRALPQYPDIFAKFASSLIGPNDEIGALQVTDNLDFEGELAVVIGKRAEGVAAADALDYVAGLTVLNDVTARDLQYRGTQWLAGKAVDGATPWGPALVTLDEVGDPQALDIVTRVNGAEMQRSNTRHQIFPIAEVIEYLTGFLSLEPGDVIATGTPEGIGAKRTPPVWLAAGDVVEIEIDRVGVLRNSVASGA